MSRETIFSQPDRKWRYTLWREWGVGTLPIAETANRKAPDDYVMFTGLNPSTADEVNDDPTIRRCIQFAKDWGYGALCMTNIFAWRDTSPERMKLVKDPIGPDNDKWLKEIAQGAGLIVAAWGNHGRHMFRGTKVKWMLDSSKLHCLRVTSKEQPEHPLYLPADLKPIPYE